MSIEILMPALSPTMTDGVLNKWLIKIGDKVKAGTIIAEIETDKATMEIEAVDEGKLTNILVKEGSQNVAVNTVIAILDGNENENINKESLKDKELYTDNENLKIEKEKDEVQNSELENQNIKKNIEKDNNEIFASPYVRKKVKDNQIDLQQIKGSGPKGRIIKRDLDQVNELQNSQELSNTISIEPSSIRKIISQKTTKTKNTVPHFYLTIETNADKILKLRKMINDQNQSYKISINDILVKALALAQHNIPETNVSWNNDKIIKYSSVDVSIAVALKEGLVTPVIKNADKKGLLEISEETKTFIKKANEGKLMPEDYTGGTISISNLGMYGITEFSAIINPPQSSILAVGSIKQVLIKKDKEIQSVSIFKSTLSADHRVLDGAIAAKLLKEFNDIIENPFSLWLNSKDMKLI